MCWIRIDVDFQGFNVTSVVLRLGLGVVPGERSFFHKNEERSRTIPSFQKKNERIERILKNIGTICKGTERNGTEIA